MNIEGMLTCSILGKEGQGVEYYNGRWKIVKYYVHGWEYNNATQHFVQMISGKRNKKYCLLITS